MTGKRSSASDMTSSASFEVSGSENGEDSRRLSHNEIERRRRDNQRDRLEELRLVLPNMRDSKASMVATIVRAKEYILQLQTRVADLERMLALAHGGHGAFSAASFIGNPVSSVSTPLAYTPGAALSSQQGLPPLAPRMGAPSGAGFTMTSITSPYLMPAQPGGASAQETDEEENKRGFKRGRHGSTALFTVPENSSKEEEESEQKLIQPPNDSGAATTNVNLKRRDSALLLPTADPNLFLYGHRDSMQNLFAAPLPFIMQQQEQKDADLKCSKCARGISNLIMIDCDKCHTWFHIRCIGLDPERIPVHWSCSNCPQ